MEVGCCTGRVTNITLSRKHRPPTTENNPLLLPTDSHETWRHCEGPSSQCSYRQGTVDRTAAPVNQRSQVSGVTYRSKVKGHRSQVSGVTQRSKVTDHRSMGSLRGHRSQVGGVTQRSKVTDKADGGVVALQRLKAVRHSVQPIRADAKTLQVPEVRPLFHLDTHFGHAGFLEQRRHLTETETTIRTLHYFTLHSSVSRVIANDAAMSPWNHAITL